MIRKNGSRFPESCFASDRGFVHAAFRLRDHFRNGGVVARRHDVDAGDAGNGRKLVDQFDADAACLRARGPRPFHTRDESRRG